MSRAAAVVLVALLLALPSSADFIGQYVQGKINVPRSPKVLANAATVTGVTPTAQGEQALAMASYDVLGGFLRFTTLVGNVYAPVRVSKQVFTGEYASSAIVNGNPAVSFFDSFNGNLGYVRATNAVGSAWASPVYPDTLRNVGMFTSLKVLGTAPSNFPAIAYLDNSHYTGGLKFVRSGDQNGDGWNAAVMVHQGSNVGLYASLAEVGGRPAIAYYALETTTLYFIRSSDGTGSTWPASPVVVDATAGAFVSLAVGASGPVISYTRESDGRLFFARASSADGSTWEAPVEIAAAAGQKVRFPSLFMLPSGIPIIAYASLPSQDVILRVASNPSGALPWASTVLATNFFCGGTSIGLINGVPHVGLYQSQQGWLYVARTSTDALTRTGFFTFDTGLSYSAQSVVLPSVSLVMIAMVAWLL